MNAPLPEDQGLVQQQMPPQQPAPEEQLPPEAVAEEDQDLVKGQAPVKPASKEIALLFQHLTQSAGRIIYDKKITPGLIEVMRARKPIKGVAVAAGMVLEKLRKEAERVGAHPNWGFVVIPMVVMMLLEVCEAAKLLKAEKAKALYPKIVQLIQQHLAKLQQEGALDAKAGPPEGEAPAEELAQEAAPEGEAPEAASAPLVEEDLPPVPQKKKLDEEERP